MQAKFFLIRENEITSYVLKSIKFNKNTSRIQNGNFQTYSTAGSSNPNNLKKSCVISIQNKYIYISTHTHTSMFQNNTQIMLWNRKKIKRKKKDNILNWVFHLIFNFFTLGMPLWHQSEIPLNLKSF